jgi:hypothetical protein
MRRVWHTKGALGTLLNKLTRPYRGKPSYLIPVNRIAFDEYRGKTCEVKYRIGSTTGPKIGPCKSLEFIGIRMKPKK